MTTWTTIPNSDIAQDKPIKAETGLALRDNVLAAGEGASGSPSFTPNIRTNSIIGTSEPTTDVSEISFTGLSGQGYRIIRLTFTLQFTAAGGANIQIRESAGTWRTIMTASTGADDVTGAVVTINNWDDAAATDFLMFYGEHWTTANPIDRSSNEEVITTTTPSVGYVARSVVFDEIRIAPVSGNIEGSTANSRGAVILEAI